jgi:hypothetical protein
LGKDTANISHYARAPFAEDTIRCQGEVKEKLPPTAGHDAHGEAGLAARCPYLRKARHHPCSSQGHPTSCVCGLIPARNAGRTFSATPALRGWRRSRWRISIHLRSAAGYRARRPQGPGRAPPASRSGSAAAPPAGRPPGLPAHRQRPHQGRALRDPAGDVGHFASGSPKPTCCR